MVPGLSLSCREQQSPQGRRFPYSGYRWWAGSQEWVWEGATRWGGSRDTGDSLAVGSREQGQGHASAQRVLGEQRLGSGDGNLNSVLESTILSPHQLCQCPSNTTASACDREGLSCAFQGGFGLCPLSPRTHLMAGRQPSAQECLFPQGSAGTSWRGDNSDGAAGHYGMAAGNSLQSSPGAFPRSRQVPPSSASEEISRSSAGQKQRWVPLLLFSVSSPQGNNCSLSAKKKTFLSEQLCSMPSLASPGAAA